MDHRDRKDLPYWMTKPAWDFNAEHSRPTTSFERKYSPENFRSSKLVSFQLPLPSTSNGELSESPGPDAPYCTANVQLPDSIFGAPTPVPFSPPLTSEIHFGRKKQTTDPGSAIHGFCTGQVFSLAAGFAAVILLSVSAKLMADVRLYAGSEDYITTTADPLLKSPSETVLFKTIIERVPHGVREAQRGHYFDRRKSGKYRTVAMKVTSTVAQKPVVQVTSSGGNEGAWRPDIDHGKRFVSAKVRIEESWVFRGSGLVRWSALNFKRFRSRDLQSFENTKEVLSVLGVIHFVICFAQWLHLRAKPADLYIFPKHSNGIPFQQKASSDFIISIS